MRLSLSVVDASSLPVGRGRAAAAVVALPVAPPADAATPSEGTDAPSDAAALQPTAWSLPEPLVTEITHLLRGVRGAGGAGTVRHLPRPTRDPGHVLLYGVGDGGRRAWRDAGAALVRAADDRHTSLVVALPGSSALAGAADVPDSVAAVAGELALGAWLAAYRFQLPGRAARRPDGDAEPPGLRRITLVTAAGDVAAVRQAVADARVLADAVALARDLTNTPSVQKSPKWFADRVTQAAARRPGVTATVLDENDLAAGGFGGVLAVGRGSRRPPRFVELSWRPRGARAHVVLAGKGICFDTGGISLKPLDGMRLMRKDMGAAAAVCATVLAAADLALPVRVTALAPLAENLVSGSSMRPGDIVRHYGGTTTEVLDTDAEGRLVLGDALAYAAKRLRPDWLIDLATLTGASHVALGKQTAALFSDCGVLAEALRAAGAEAGEPVWPLPLPDDYVGLLHSDVADRANIGRPSQAGAVVAALYLRELAGDHRDCWAHIDMSAPAWSDRDNGPLVKGATGWGVRLLVAFLRAVASGAVPAPGQG
ncbi:MAG: leucyl aminopeptidase family protein [Micromonosporaceae bacterium]|nr:leucyl aminopeptidase family protein [Micromonosporaceae bacterium]